VKSEMRIQLHDVPQDRASAELNQRFGPILSFLTQARALTATEYNNLDQFSLFSKGFKLPEPQNNTRVLSLPAFSCQVVPRLERVQVVYRSTYSKFLGNTQQ